MATNPNPRRRSRDRWSGPSVKIPGCTVPETLRDQVQRIADRDGVTFAAVQRRALQAEVDRAE